MNAVWNKQTFIKQKIKKQFQNKIRSLNHLLFKPSFITVCEQYQTVFFAYLIWPSILTVATAGKSQCTLRYWGSIVSLETLPSCLCFSVSCNLIGYAWKVSSKQGLGSYFELRVQWQGIHPEWWVAWLCSLDSGAGWCRDLAVCLRYKESC